MSAKPSHPPHLAHHQDDTPWLKYPGPDKAANDHSRSFAPASPDHPPFARAHPHAPALKHKRSASRLHSSNTSNASLPMSLAGSNSSCDSLGHHFHASPSLSSTKPRTLSEELAFTFQANTTNVSSSVVDTNMPHAASSRTSYPSPISPSDLLGIPDRSTTLAASSFSSSSSTAMSPLLGQDLQADSSSPKSGPASPKPRPSPLSIDTSFNNATAVPGSRFAYHSVTSYAKTNPQLVALDRIQLSGRAASKVIHRSNAPEHDDGFADIDGEQQPDDLVLNDMPLEMEETVTSTAVTIVGSTPEFGIGAFRDQRARDDAIMGLDSTEPPKKRQRSTAAVLLGAAVETVIFTSAVALSAYQLLTGKGRQQLDANLAVTEGPTTNESSESNQVLETKKPVVHVKSVPVSIQARSLRHKTSGPLGKSLHPHMNSQRHKSRHHKSSYKSRHDLSTSLPHSFGDDSDFLKGGELTLLERPNTGTEDNDEQFLRMEAQLSSLIAEGKRALNSRIPTWTEA
ncbi:hypothetical protein BGZ99_008316 [Dissophora globulifera]|uniref:Uncharacterized protein n=1 Tax=Dissophora globulifera TaxID=979702 RepID=A0A9P6RS50_9FUNG|nr:hypothetical protein BGZ99_008316 [Dissophora globulifera]